jgi:hypothetical protein
MKISPKVSLFARRLAERVIWTAAEAGVGYAAIQVADLNPAWAVPVATLAAYLKGIIAHHIGDPNDPSIMPALPAPAPAEAE